MEIKFNYDTGNWEPVYINPRYDGKYGWIFKNLDTPPFYNCYVSESTYNKVKKELVNEYECKTYESLNTLDGKKGYKLVKIR